jgi:hypothetical protein
MKQGLGTMNWKVEIKDWGLGIGRNVGKLVMGVWCWELGEK